MIPRKATAWVFLAFSVLVAFKNYINGEYQYILITLPFIAAVLSESRISRICEVVGLVATSCYIMAFQVFHVGMIGMVISSVFFFTLGYNLRIARIYIFASIAVVSICSYYQYIRVENMLLRASYDAGLYAVCSFCVYIALQDYISSNVVKAMEIASRAIDIAEREDK